MPLERHRRRIQSLETPVPSNVLAGSATISHQARNRAAVRPGQVLEVLQRIDVTSDPALRQALLDWLQQVYDQRQGGELVGLFSRCYLGHPFLDHQLSLTGRIVEHYEHTQQPPPPFGSVRSLARSPAYAYIEIYSDGAVVPVRPNGTQAV